MKWLLTLVFITQSLLFFKFCQKAEKGFTPMGYWEVNIYENEKQTNWLCEITDSTFTYWHKDVNFFPPEQYSIVHGNLFFKRRDSPDSFFIGEIQSIDENRFKVKYQPEITYEFLRVDSLFFNRKTTGYE